MGKDESLWRCERGDPGLGPPLAPAVWFDAKIVVFEEEFREPWGRMARVVLIGVSGRLPSFFGRGESFRMDSDDGARPPPDAVRLMPSATVAGPGPPGSEPGIGDGALEPFVAAALRI